MSVEQLELGQVDDPYTRRALERLSLRSNTGAAGATGATGPAGVNWTGAWDPARSYVKGDGVSYNGSSWIAPTAMAPGVTPGVVVADPQIGTVRTVRVYASDRLNSSSYVGKTITAASDVTDISAVRAEAVLIDRTTTSAHDVSFRNDHASASLNAAVYDLSNNYQFLSFSGLAPGAETTLSLPSGSADLVAIVYFNPSANTIGSFAVKTTNPATLVAPPTIPTPWDLLASKGDPGATTGDKNYVHTQSTLSASWSVSHGLAKFPAVDVVDTGGSAVMPDVLYVDANSVTLTFAAPTSGKAFVN